MYHTIIVVGNVGQDAEMRYTPSGAAVASFSVATNRQYTASSGEKVKRDCLVPHFSLGKAGRSLQSVCEKRS